MFLTGEVEGIKKSDRAHFEYLFEKYSRELYVFAYRMVGDKEMAEDVVQDFFVKLWINRYKIKVEGAFRSYCYTSIHHGSLNAIRAKCKHMDLSEDLVSSTDIEFEMERAVLRQKLDKAINLLPERCREIFVDICVDEHSYAEAAQKYNLSVNTIKVQMSKAYRILRENLSKEQLFLLFICLGEHMFRSCRNVE